MKVYRGHVSDVLKRHRRSAPYNRYTIPEVLTNDVGMSFPLPLTIANVSNFSLFYGLYLYIVKNTQEWN